MSLSSCHFGGSFSLLQLNYKLCKARILSLTLKALNKATYVLKGSYAFNIINDDYPDTIFGIRKDRGDLEIPWRNVKKIGNDMIIIEYDGIY